MSFKEKMAEYGENFSRKAVFDVILSCKICIVIVFGIYAAVFWVSALPKAYAFSLAPKVIMTLLCALFSTIITMPLYFVGMVVLGLMFRVCQDGRCCLCSGIKKLMGISRG
ncbi:MAG: hypothetical protein AB7E96_07705 [Deferribacterales bacterium]